jgi:predicted nucleic acid-binding protein
VINPLRIAEESPRLFISVVALLVVMLAIVLIVSSRTGSSVQIVGIDNNKEVFLDDGSYIQGWSSLDRDSAHIGEVVNFHINIIYNAEYVEPDIKVFERSVDVMPLEKIRFSEAFFTLDGGLNKYVLDYQLQVVNVELDTSYQIDPSVIYYTTTGESVLKSIQIPSPSIHVTSYYPYDVSAIELKEIKGRAPEYSIFTRAFLLIGGIVLIALCVISIIKFCSRKNNAELSKAESLWLEYQSSNTNSDNRISVSGSERIFTQLLEAQTAIKPAKFWSGHDPEDSFWMEIANKARALLRTIYKPSGPDNDDVNNTSILLHETFSHVINEEKRIALNEPSLIRRLISQKKIMFMSGSCLLSGVALLIFSAWPGIWVPQTILTYNKLVESVQNQEYIDEFATQFSDLAKEISDARLKAAAFYNSATLLAANVQMLDVDQMLTEGGAFSDVAEDERVIQDAEDLLEVLANNVEIYRKSELQLREAVRLDSNDENIKRNLELVIKRRKALLHIINTLMETGHLQQVEIDELLNLLESQMALEFKVEEGKEAPGYYIGEDF